MKIVLDLALSSAARCQRINIPAQVDFNSCKLAIFFGNYSKLIFIICSTGYLNVYSMCALL